jgi:hypothetical protein
LAFSDRVGFCERLQQCDALAVITTLESGFRGCQCFGHRLTAAQHHRSDACISKDFKEKSVGDTTIHDVRCGNPLGKGTNATFRFGRHPTGNNTVVDQLPRLREPELSN